MRYVGKKVRAKAVAVAGALVLAGCGLSDVTIPGFDGPATLALNLDVYATPDYVRADGHSTSMVRVQLRGPDGQPVSGRQVVLALADSTGVWVDIGVLSRERVTTGSDGTAQVKYTAPLRQHFTANSSVLVTARTVGTDALAAVYRAASIEIRSVETKSYSGGGNPPACSFAVDPPIGPYYVNQSIHFQSTSVDPDVGGFVTKYFWYFGDPTDPEKNSDLPELYHHWSSAGTYTVVHVVTDNSGNQKDCSRDVEILDAP
jgi:hypothetical protein